MKKTNVLHIITRLDMGGSAQNTLLTCLGHDRKKYHTTLVHGLSLESKMTAAEKTAVGHLTDKAKSAGVAVVPVPALVRRIHPFWDTAAFFSILRIILRTRPAIVHTHTSKAGILGRLAARVAGVPDIVHTPHGHLFYGHFHPAATEIFRVAEKIMAPVTTRYIALANGEKKDHMAYLNMASEKIAVIHSGVDIGKFRSSKVDISAKKRGLGLSAKGKIIGTAGWLLPIKGPVHLLNAMKPILAQHPNTRLVFAGKGGLEGELKQSARSMGISDNVSFLGWRGDMDEIMRILDIFVLPSLNEGMGRVVVEAMAAGNPIVASDTGGIPDLVEHGENGYLVPPGDEKALANAILSLLDHPDDCAKMGEKGRTRAESFSVASMTAKIELLYQELAS